MSEISALIQANLDRELGESEFSQFLQLLGKALPSERQNSVEHLLRLVPLTPAQTLALARVDQVVDSIALQLVLKRYVREREYAAERKRYAERSEWVKVAELLAVLTPF